MAFSLYVFITCSALLFNSWLPKVSCSSDPLGELDDVGSGEGEDPRPGASPPTHHYPEDQEGSGWDVPPKTTTSAYGATYDDTEDDYDDDDDDDYFYDDKGEAEGSGDRHLGILTTDDDVTDEDTIEIHSPVGEDIVKVIQPPTEEDAKEDEIYLENSVPALGETPKGHMPSSTPPPTLTDTHQEMDIRIYSQADEERQVSIFAQPGILAAFIGGAVVGLLCAILIVMFIVYRMRKRDEGSYPLDEPKRMPLTASYSPHDKEIYA